MKFCVLQILVHAYSFCSLVVREFVKVSQVKSSQVRNVSVKSLAVVLLKIETFDGVQSSTLTPTKGSGRLWAVIRKQTEKSSI